jgi:prepilin-type N-terminal cleavage/methylation domain-containing protein
MKKSGFTLVEMLIVMTILAGITIMTGQTINKALRAKRKFTSEIEQTAVMRDTLRIIERDINMAFHYRNIHYEVLKKIKEETGPQTPGVPGVPPPPPPKPGDTPPVTPAATTPLLEDLKEPPPNFTQFLGENDSLYFTSVSHVRTLTDAAESDQTEVGYFVKNCKRRPSSLNPKSQRASTSCLWRKEALFLDDDLMKGGSEAPLLENVEKFELLYFGEEREGWQKTWRTDEKGSEDIRGRFPQAVQIKLTVADEDENSKKKYSMVLVAALRFPNNPTLNKSDRKDTPNDKVNLPTNTQ